MNCKICIKSKSQMFVNWQAQYTLHCTFNLWFKPLVNCQCKVYLFCLHVSLFIFQLLLMDAFMFCFSNTSLFLFVALEFAVLCTSSPLKAKIISMGNNWKYNYGMGGCIWHWYIKALEELTKRRRKKKLIKQNLAMTWKNGSKCLFSLLL